MFSFHLKLTNGSDLEWKSLLCIRLDWISRTSSHDIGRTTHVKMYRWITRLRYVENIHLSISHP